MPKLTPRSKEWLSCNREHTRWADVRMVTVRTTHEERQGMAGDISIGGMQLALAGNELPMLDRPIEIDVAYEEEVVRFLGRPVYAIRKDWGVLIGVRLPRQTPDVQDFLAKRYPSSPEESNR